MLFEISCGLLYHIQNFSTETQLKIQFLKSKESCSGKFFSSLLIQYVSMYCIFICLGIIN